MKTKFIQQKGFLLTLLASILLVLITEVNNYAKEYFVTETGNFKILGGLGLILAIGLLLKWKYFRQISAVISGFLMGIVLIFGFSAGSQFLMSYMVLATTLLLLFVLLLSKPVILYSKSNQ
ncbi:hypothetical protein [Plebeiibacterium sediminum]|uniref:Uncharacterized protein n=1 Tax=Plebeiibacterium sediminum TaxID=2992112 RepID=A0AAE3SH34_9BACT|nr:hypothetical protein [Plebeiobacterium sediminum]MCW3789150.1 hypothetical protein [Plebeiobacterium sediminum]